MEITPDKFVVYVVDDDPSIRRAFSRLLSGSGFLPIAFDSATHLLDSEQPQLPDCIILDLCMPGLSGLDLQAELNARNVHAPIIFVSGTGDIPTTIGAMRAGAEDFLPKPVDDDALLAAVRRAISKANPRRASGRAVE